MKTNKLLLILTLTAALLIFAGCKAAPVPEVTPAPDPAAPTDPGMPISDTEPAADTQIQPAAVTVDFATEELINEYPAVEEFDEEGISQKIIITTDTAVSDFKYFTVSYTEKGDELAFEAAKVLYSAKELSPERPFAVTWEDIGLIPNRGFSYVDTDGSTRCFTITQSGEDGSMITVEFEELK